MAKRALSRQERIYQALLEGIHDGSYPPGENLPPVRELAARFKTSITPAYLAVNRLYKEGYVSTAHGSGIQVVTRNPKEARVQRKPSVDFLGSTLNFDLDAEGRPVSSRFILASSDWLLWGLSHTPEIRLVVSHFKYADPEAFYQTLSDCEFSSSKVIAFADPENFNQKTLHLLNRLHKEGKRVAHLGNREDLPHFARVRGDFSAGSHALTRHVLEQGHTCLLRLNTTFDSWYELKKQEGYERAIDDWNRETGANVMGLTRPVESMRLDPEGHAEADWDESLLREVLEFHPVTAILAPSDASVLYLRHAAHLLGRDDLEITGYDASWDDHDVYPHADFIKKHKQNLRLDQPPISVDIQAAHLGSELARLAVARALGNLPSEPQTILCPQTLTLPETAPSH